MSSPLVLTRRTSHEATLEVAEALLGALARSGCSAEVLLAASGRSTGLIIGLAQAQLGSANPRDLMAIQMPMLPKPNPCRMTGSRSCAK